MTASSVASFVGGYVSSIARDTTSLYLMAITTASVTTNYQYNLIRVDLSNDTSSTIAPNAMVGLCGNFPTLALGAGSVYAKCTRGIIAIPVGGGTVTVPVTFDGGSSSTLGPDLAADSTALYFVQAGGAGWEIKSVPHGSTPAAHRVLATGAFTGPLPSALATDGVDIFLQVDGNLAKVSTDGGSIGVVAAPPAGGTKNVMLDSTYAYFAHQSGTARALKTASGGAPQSIGSGAPFVLESGYLYLVQPEPFPATTGASVVRTLPDGGSFQRLWKDLTIKRIDAIAASGNNVYFAYEKTQSDGGVDSTLAKITVP